MTIIWARAPKALVRWARNEIGLPGALLILGYAASIEGVYRLWGEGQALLAGGIALTIAGIIGGIVERER